MKTDLFQSCGHCCIFQICWYIECSTFTTSSFRIWNSSTEFHHLHLLCLQWCFLKSTWLHILGCLALAEREWSHHHGYLGWRSFLYRSSVYSWHLFLISSASARSITFLSFMDPVFAWNSPLVSLIFLKRSLGFPIPLFSSISFADRWGSLSYFSLLFFGTLYSDGYSFPFLLCFSLLFFSELFVRPSQTAILLFLHFFSMGMVLIPVSCTMSRTLFHSSSGTLSIRSRPLNLILTSTV